MKNLLLALGLAGALLGSSAAHAVYTFSSTQTLTFAQSSNYRATHTYTGNQASSSPARPRR